MLTLRGAALLIVALFTLTISIGRAGSLDPPAAPVGSPTQIVARGTPIVALPFTIDQPGSYHATGNLNAAPGQPGITVTANHVAIDLNGFRLQGFTGLGSPRGSVAIVATGEVNITVSNGNIDGWVEGVRLADCRLSTVRDLQVSGIGTLGSFQMSALRVGDRSTVRRCALENCLTQGIRTGVQSHVTDCVVVNCDGGGISTGSGCQVVRCTVEQCGESSNQLTQGIQVGSACIVESCSVNGSRGGDFFGGLGGCGILAQSRCVIRDCLIDENAGHGIQASGLSRIEGCNAVANGASGINTTNAGCRITDNLSAGNAGDGLVVAASSLVTGNLIRGNANAPIHGNAQPSLIVGNASFDHSGMILVPATPGYARGYGPPAFFDETDVPLPWANFSYIGLTPISGSEEAKKER